MHYDITPAQMHALTGLNQDLQRNYRMRGMLKGVGTPSDTGRFLFSVEDARAILDARILQSEGVPFAKVIEWALSGKSGAVIKALGLADRFYERAKWKIAVRSLSEEVS